MRSNESPTTVVVVGGRIYISKPAPKPNPLPTWLTKKAISGVDKISDRILRQFWRLRTWYKNRTNAISRRG